MNLKDKINILYLKDVKNMLENEYIRYFIYNNENKLEVEFLPIFYNGYLTNLYNYLAYDYDELNDNFKEEYKYIYKSIIKKDNYYEYDIKKYIKKTQK